MSDFKKRVLEPSIKQINEHTDIKVTYNSIKKGVQFQVFHSNLSKNNNQKLKLNEIQTPLTFYKNDRCTTPFICQ
jgi:plasmid replication initiation protein